MEQIINAIVHHDLKALIQVIGYPGVWGIIFAESGLLIGFFLPGDSLIFTAGFLSSPTLGALKTFDIKTLLVGAWIAAVVGDNVGYEFGKRVGVKLFSKEDSILFHRKHLVKAQEFYEKHGGKAIVLARFMPMIRTFAPIVAGIGNMDHKKFMLYNFLGGTLWVWGLGLAGYFLGNTVKDVDKYLLPIVGAIAFISIAPVVLHFVRDWLESKKTKIS